MGLYGRPIIYDQSMVRDYDHLWGWKGAEYARSQQFADLLGGVNTVVTGLGVTPTSPASLTVDIAAGDIYQLAVLDSSAFGSLSSDANQTMMQGFAAAQTVLLSTSGLAVGQSRWALISASFSQADEIPGDDPTGGLLYYLNSANPSGPPYTGPNNDNVAQNTRRQGICTITVTYGAVATTGSEVPPNPPGNSVGLYLVDLTYGQATITAPEILLAGPSAGTNVPSNYPIAPFLAGLDQKETVGTYAGNPNGNVAGTAVGTAGTPAAPNVVYDTVHKLMWFCLTTGSVVTAVWISAEAILGVTPSGGFINKFYNGSCQIASRGTSVTITAGAAAAYSLDGVMAACTGANMAVSQASGLPTSILSPNGVQLTAATGITDAFLIRPIESIDAAFLAGRSCVFQVKLYSTLGSGVTPTLTIKHAGAAGDNWATSSVDVSSVSLQSCPGGGTVTQLSYVFTANVNFGHGASVRLDFGAGLNASSGYIVLADWDIRVGLGDVLAIPEIRPYFVEQLQCARYLPVFGGLTSGAAPVIPSGNYSSPTTTSGNLAADFVVQTRVQPQSLITSAMSSFQIQFEGGFGTITSLAMAAASQTGVQISFSGASIGAAAAACWLASAGGPAYVLLGGCEIVGTAI